MEIKRITGEEYDKFYGMLEDDFCADERKSKDAEFEAFADEKFSPNFIYDGDNLLGYVCFWNFDNFVYIEHLAIAKQLRGHGIGSKFLNEFVLNFKKDIILEAELPVETIAKKRISFYERNGFVLNPYEYYQPAYREDSNTVPMLVMSHGNKLPENIFNSYIEKIKQHVYHK